MDILLITIGIYLLIGFILALISINGVKVNKTSMFVKITLFWLIALVYSWYYKKIEK